MHRFFIEPEKIDMDSGICRITGSDVNHIGNVLRMKRGERVLLSTGEKEDPVEYLCEIDEIRSEEVTARILDLMKNARELPSDLYLFQAIPKGDRFETVIEKSVELGVHQIIPVLSARTIVKLDEKRSEKKTVRWNALALSAAKQSKRSFIPEVAGPVRWEEAMKLAASLDRILVPYENAEGIRHTERVLEHLRPGESIGIFIGPEGGFEEREIAQLSETGAEVITLGHRILRTDTAAITTLSLLMYALEKQQP
jgi:16S rRNA (uracil1498-N3)-methyltransferase